MSNESNIMKRVEFHKALANPIRVQIVDFLMKGEQCQCDIFPKFNLAQSTGSAYLSKLVRAGVLKYRKDGTRKLYRIANPKIKGLIEKIIQLLEE